MKIRKLIAIVLLTFITGFASAQSVERTINEYLQRFYDTNKLQGGISVAISRNGKLVYIGSVGYTDSNNKAKLTPEYRMRIASITKQMTKMAILKLHEEGRLNFNDNVFGTAGIFNNEYGMPILNGNHVDVTVQQLLDHRSGGWAEGPPIRLTSKALIAKVLEIQPLEHSPDTQYAYSNFGYYVLGAVVEKVSGMTYENYVKENILKPAGIYGMRIGSTISGSDEVEYIATPGSTVTNPATQQNPVNMFSYGGWVASPIELLKFLTYWGDTLGNNWTHGGSMAGTYSWVEKRRDGFNYVMLTNYRSPAPTFNRSQFFSGLRAAITDWPTGIEF
jgi:CubicO group peptidase (beta-lactamase class C family)